jgi:hypothetical protein
MTNTTIADHGRCRKKWPPSATHEALRPTLMHQMDGKQPPEQADITFGGVEGVYGPQNPPKLYLLPREVVTHPFDALARSARPHVGHWGAISAGGGHGCGSCDASCVCAKATEKCNKNTKISCL